MRLLTTRRPLAGLAALTLFVGACAPSPSTPPAATSASTVAPAAPTTAAPPTPTTAAAAATTAPAATAAPTAQPAAGGAGAIIQASLANLSKTLHPYPDAASYTQSWIDSSILIWGGGDGGGGLLEYDWNALQWKAAMARDLPKVSADGKTFTFTLRDDLKWSDGQPITVDDFLYAYEQASKEENNYVQLDIVQDIASFKAPDKSTIEVALKEAKPRDLALGVASVIGPVPKHVWDGKAWNDTSSNPEILNPSVVLGPFKVQDFKIAERGVYTPVETYYVGRPRAPRVEILASQQPTVAYESLKAGRANWVHSLPPAQYQDAKSNPDLALVEWTAANAGYRALEFNTTRPFLSDKRVREALAVGVSRADILDIAEQGLAVPQYSFIQPTNENWVNTNVEKYDLNMDLAKQLLQEAGYSLRNGQLMGKDGQPIRVQVLYPTSSGPRAKIAAYLQQQYKLLGIDVEVKGLDFNAYTDQVSSRKDFDISLATWGGGQLDPDLGPKAQLVSTGQQNVTGYNNPQVDELFKQAAGELDSAKRKQMYDQIQQLVNADLPSHYLYALKAVDAFSKKVQGVVPHKGDRLDYNDALLSWSVPE
jgi:peptide/nickel transport system substrate-binding protein